MSDIAQCVLKREKRARALDGCHDNATKVAFYGCTIWLTGLPCAGKTTLARATEEFLLEHGIAAYCLDEECLKNGLNNNLNPAGIDRTEYIRRAAETAKLFADSGQVCIVSLVSPLEKDRVLARQIHEQASVRFFEVYINTPVDVCLNVRAKANNMAHRIIEDLPYEAPEKPDLAVPMVDGTDVYDCVQRVIGLLVDNKTFPATLLDTIPELFVADEKLKEATEDAKKLPVLEIKDVHLQWIQVLAEGWAAPLRGFMNEKQYLQCLHFGTFTDEKWGTVSNLPVPITLSLSLEDKERLLNKKSIALSYTGPHTTESKIVAILHNPEFFEHRKEERCCRIFGTSNPGHPGVHDILSAGDWLVGGEIEVLGRIKWGDDLDSYRLTPNELRKKFRELGADAVFAYQLRHPLHNGHALLMADTHKKLKERGFKKSFLFLQILAGVAKEDDIPLSVRIRQHAAVFDANLEGLRREETVMTIFPSPLLYAGPLEVQWHCRMRMIAGGGSFYIVPRDPAGVPNPANKAQSLYEPTHGAKVLVLAPGMEHMEILPLRIAVYDRIMKKMVLYDDNSHGDFDFIDAAKLRALIRSGTEPPPGFMVQNAWRILVKSS